MEMHVSRVTENRMTTAKINNKKKEYLIFLLIKCSNMETVTKVKINLHFRVGEFTKADIEMKSRGKN